MKSPIAALSLVLSSICVAMTAFASEIDTAFECPDDKALKLLDLASTARRLNYGFKDSISAFSYVIENANRPMDEVALQRACFGLARDSYITEHYGPVGAADVFGLIPPKEAVSSLKDKHPILSRCPDHSLYERQLPVSIRGKAYAPQKEAVRLGITGWVDLELEVRNDGIVESARIIDSSNPILEAGVIDHVLTFRYPKSSHYNGHYMRRKGFQVRITTDYFQIARENGCRWDDPQH
jgi:hypothetical protein